jgi:hypothetical protein
MKFHTESHLGGACCPGPTGDQQADEKSGGQTAEMR